MKFTIAAVAFAAGASATYPVAANTTAYTTEVVTSYETYCPGPTQITYGTNTYTVTEVRDAIAINSHKPATNKIHRLPPSPSPTALAPSASPSTLLRTSPALPGKMAVFITKKY